MEKGCAAKLFSHGLFYLIFITFTLFAKNNIQYYRGKCVPPDGKTLLIIGQDLASCWNYVQSGKFPVPSGTTTYINAYSNYGLQGGDVNWGAGPLCAEKNVNGYPQSVVVMATYMVESGGNSLSNMANGGYDAHIDHLAHFIKNAQRPIYVRVGYEFDGNWNHYHPGRYKAAYRRVVTRIRAIAKDNFISVWQSCTSPIDDAIEGFHENIGDWYPGDDYVDWCGLSWFINHNKQYELADELLTFARNHKKPVMIAESSPQGYDIQALTKKNLSPVWDGPAGQNSVSKSADDIWNEWFAPYFKYIHDNKDVIRAVAYINADWDSQAKWGPPYSEGYWGDSRVETNPTITSKWNNEITSDFWLPGSNDLFKILLEGVTDNKTKPQKLFHSEKLLFKSKINGSHIDFVFHLPQSGPVELTIRNSHGQKLVGKFIDGKIGFNQYQWNRSENLRSGILFAQLRVNNQILGSSSMLYLAK